MISDKLLNRQILAENIDRDRIGQKLTTQARERAINFAESVFKGDMGNGRASELGIKHVIADIFKP